MPRTGGVFSLLSGSKGTPNTTIQSAPYNAQLDDFVQDANLARPITAGGTGATNVTQMRINFGLVPGTDIQAYSAALKSIADLTTSANQLIYTTGADAYATTALTAFARTILDDADAAAVRTTIGLGSLSTLNSVNNGNWSGADLAIANGGTGASDVAAAQTALSLDNKVIYSPKSVNYTAVAGDNNSVLMFSASATLSLTAANTLGANWHLRVIADGGAVVIDPSGSELVNGLTTILVLQGYACDIVCTGTEFKAVLIAFPASTGVLSGFRNKVINPSFDIWQRGNGPFTTGYCADRWSVVFGTGASTSVTRSNFVPTDSVPFVDKYCLNWARTVAGSASSFVGQKIEGVRTLAGKKVTLTLWASANAAITLRPYLQQNFGTGGSPSAIVWNSPTSTPQNLVFAGDGVMRKFSFTFDLPKITSKTLGTNNDDVLWLLLEWQSAEPNGTVTLSHVSLVEGDARTEVDPIAARSLAEENALCDRYYQLHEGTFFAFAGSGTASVRRYQLSFRSTMRGIPNVAWNSGASFSLDERTTHMARWFTDPGNSSSELALGTIRLDAEL